MLLTAESVEHAIRETAASIGQTYYEDSMVMGSMYRKDTKKIVPEGRDAKIFILAHKMVSTRSIRDGSLSDIANRAVMMFYLAFSNEDGIIHLLNLDYKNGGLGEITTQLAPVVYETITDIVRKGPDAGPGKLSMQDNADSESFGWVLGRRFRTYIDDTKRLEEIFSEDE